MKKRDCIVKGLVFDESMAVTLLDCTNLVNVCIQKHGLMPLSAMAMARVLLVGGYLSANLKDEEDSCSITIKGDGLGGDIFVSGNYQMQLRGYIANVNVVADKNGGMNLADCIGKNGTMTVLYQDNGQNCAGTTSLVSGDVTEDCIAYFTQSEQRYVDMHLMVKLNEKGECLMACGVCLQALPNTEDSTLKKAVQFMQTVYANESLFEEQEILTVWDRLIGNLPLIERYPTYTCTCSREKMQNLLLTLGKAELEDILKEQGKIEIHCHYCNTDYFFDKGDIDKLFVG